MAASVASASSGTGITLMAKAIEDDCRQFESFLEKWVANQHTIMSNFQAQDTANAHECKEKLDILQAQENQLSKDGEIRIQMRNKEQKALAERNQELEVLKASVATAAAKKATMEEFVEAERKNLQEQSLSLAEAERARDQKVAELNQGVSFYRERLSLTFEKLADSTLRFVFTNIDPVNFSRKFYFGILINEENKYMLVECVPEIKDAAPLVDALNASNDFSAFCRSMRSKFKAAAATTRN